MWRRTGTGLDVVAELTDSAATSFVDSNLVGNTEYAYRVTVLTEKGEEIPGEEVSGTIHRLLATWPIDLNAEVGSRGDFARLYIEPGDRIAVLVAGTRERLESQVRLIFYDTEGQFLEEQILLDLPRVNFSSDRSFIAERAVSTALSRDFTTVHFLGILFRRGGS